MKYEVINRKMSKMKKKWRMNQFKRLVYKNSSVTQELSSWEKSFRNRAKSMIAAVVRTGTNKSNCSTMDNFSYKTTKNIT